MAQCKWCGRSDDSLNLTEKGLCETCSPVITVDISNRLGMIKYCKKIVRESEEPNTLLAKSDLIVEQAQALLEYEKRGIPTIRPSPSKLIQAYRQGREALILKCAESMVEKAVAATEALTSTDTKISWLKKIFPRIQQYKTSTDNHELFDDLEQRVIHLIQQTQLTGYLEKAREAVRKGHEKRALDLYKSALHFLKEDETDEALRQENMPAVEAKIAELEGVEEPESPNDSAT
jgi:hypothetical protein